MQAGASVLAPSCGPCLGTGQGIPASNINVISTANRNFKGRMGNKETNIYLASPATVAFSAINGYISNPYVDQKQQFPFPKQQVATVEVEKNDDRLSHKVWNYADVHNMNTDAMFAGSLTYNVKSSEPKRYYPIFLPGLMRLLLRVGEGDIIVAGEISVAAVRVDPAVGLAFAGVQAVICKSVNRIFYRSAINQGLPILVCPKRWTITKR